MSKRKILVVDDHRPSALALSVRLRAAGFEVQTALDAESASVLALRARPDLILLDMDMPRYSGLEWHECLRFSERGRSIPVVYLCDDGAPTHRLQAYRQGARAVLSKPYDLPRLMAAVFGVLGQGPGGVGAAVPSC